MNTAPQQNVLLALACFGCLVGCGGEQPRDLPKAKVSGTVTFAGHDLPEGRIVFQHSSGEQSAAAFGADGKYDAQVPVGANDVMVESKVVVQTEGKEGGMRAMEQYTNRVPERYSSFGTSNLDVDVPEGGRTFDVALAP